MKNATISFRFLRVTQSQLFDLGVIGLRDGLVSIEFVRRFSGLLNFALLAAEA